LARLLHVARLTITDASLENVWCEPGRGLDKTLVRDLATCKWIRNKHNVIIVGKTGVGKSYLGAALAQAACRKGLRAMCTRVPRLAHELAIARADGTYTALLGRLARLDVLVLDDFLIAPLKDTERRDLLEVLEDRYGTSSTVVTSQVPTKTWHEMLADPTIADAICDRLVHNAHVIALKGPSGREKERAQIDSTHCVSFHPSLRSDTRHSLSLRSDGARVLRNECPDHARTTARIVRNTQSMSKVQTTMPPCSGTCRCNRRKSFRLSVTQRTPRGWRTRGRQGQAMPARRSQPLAPSAHRGPISSTLEQLARVDSRPRRDEPRLTRPRSRQSALR
jgi:DNA replication protein DnaC